MTTGAVETHSFNGTEKYLAGDAAQRVVVSADELGVAYIGRVGLSVYVPALPDLGDEVHMFRVAALGVIPEQVLRWDVDRDRQNSLKRFAYMLGLRAVPLALCDIDGLPDVLERLRFGTVEFGRPNHATIATAAVKMLANYLGSGENHSKAVRPGRMNVWYEPPVDKDRQRCLQKAIAEAFEKRVS